MGDVLTSLNFSNMLQFHRETRAELTVGVCRYKMRVPFGVLNVAAGHVLSVDEKPDADFLINSGLYVVEHSALELVPDREAYYMTDPIEEHWVDIGREEDLQRAMHQAEVWGHRLLRPGTEKEDDT